MDIILKVFLIYLIFAIPLLGIDVFFMEISLLRNKDIYKKWVTFKYKYKYKILFAIFTKSPSEKDRFLPIWKQSKVKVDSWKTTPFIYYLCIVLLLDQFDSLKDFSFNDVSLSSEFYFQAFRYYTLIFILLPVVIHLIICIKTWSNELHDRIFLKRNG